MPTTRTIGRRRRGPPAGAALAPLAFALALAPTLAAAAPWAQTGRMQLRHDLQRLADAGVIDGVLATWPVPWQSVAEAVRIDPEGADTPALEAAARRVRQAALAAQLDDGTTFRVEAGGADSPSLLRGYTDQPRAEAEARAAIENRSGPFAGRLSVTAVSDPPDDEEFRIDGSYATWQWGDWWLGAGAIDRWWGPGWDGSLILSNNARPVPGIMAERASAEPFDTKWLSWLGPWRLSTFVGRLEDDRVVSEGIFHGMRVAFQPTDTLTVGLSRTAQFGGRGRSEDLDTIVDMLVGKDNQVDQEGPGNQLAGWDVRWAPDWFDIDTAFYVQRIGEDFSGGIPTRQMTLLGSEFAGGWGGDTWRIFLEYADTRSAGTEFLDADIDAQDISYNHGTFRDGYTFEGRVLGHTIDSDSRLASIGGIYVMTSSGHTIDWTVRTGELNLNGSGRSSVAPEGAEIDSLRVGYTLPWRKTEIRLRAGVDRLTDLDGGDESTGGFIAASIAYRY